MVFGSRLDRSMEYIQVFTKAFVVMKSNEPSSDAVLLRSDETMGTRAECFVGRRKRPTRGPNATYQSARAWREPGRDTIRHDAVGCENRFRGRRDLLSPGGNCWLCLMCWSCQTQSSTGFYSIGYDMNPDKTQGSQRGEGEEKEKRKKKRRGHAYDLGTWSGQAGGGDHADVR